MRGISPSHHQQEERKYKEMTEDQIDFVVSVRDYLYEQGEGWYASLLQEVLDIENEKNEEPAAASSSGD